jgi:hypothetical protein
MQEYLAYWFDHFEVRMDWGHWETAVCNKHKKIILKGLDNYRTFIFHGHFMTANLPVEKKSLDCGNI